jgi:hypothetical protein
MSDNSSLDDGSSSSSSMPQIALGIGCLSLFVTVVYIGYTATKTTTATTLYKTDLIKVGGDQSAKTGVNTVAWDKTENKIHSQQVLLFYNQIKRLSQTQAVTLYIGYIQHTIRRNTEQC